MDEMISVYQGECCNCHNDLEDHDFERPSGELFNGLCARCNRVAKRCCRCGGVRKPSLEQCSCGCKKFF